MLTTLAGGACCAIASAQAAAGNGDQAADAAPVAPVDIPPLVVDEPARPWRVQSALGLPAWIAIEGDHRTRYEYLEGRFRAGRSGSDQGFFFRTRVKLTVSAAEGGVGGFGPEAVVEFVDTRQALADEGSAISSTAVNPAEIVQAFGRLRFGDDASPFGIESFVQAGRFTLDLGSGRLIARHNFRNAFQTYTGVLAGVDGARGERLRAFWTLPSLRRPGNLDALLDNSVALDEEDIDVQLFGVYARLPVLGEPQAREPGRLIAAAAAEAFAYGLLEDDSTGRPTRNRNLATLGGRIVTRPTPGYADAELEAAVQFGSSRLSTSSTDDLNHLAFYTHAEVGYTLATAGPDTDRGTRLALEFDFATGDGDPDDGDNGRFDQLFGSRRGDFGPTGTFGPFGASNVIAVGYRVETDPTERLSIDIGQRWYWLADSSDAWPFAGLQDPTGASGRTLGTLPEVRVRYELVPGSVQLEAGAAILFKGDFARNAPAAPDDDTSVFAYASTTVRF
ncbi:MAG: alginate export family protein [Planctomycetota bacterium]